MCLFVQALIKSSSWPFMWVLLLEPERKQPLMLYPRPLRVPAAWARGHYPCIHDRARDRDAAIGKAEELLQTLSPILCMLQRDGSRNATKREGFVFCEWLSVSLTRAQFPRFLTFLAMSRLKMAALNETPPACSPKPAAFEHYSRSQQIKIAALPYRLFAIIKTLS